MIKPVSIIAAALLAAAPVMAQKALYVKQGETVTRYNFGVAEDLKFGNNGKSLTVTGYNETIDLDGVDWISFNAPVDPYSVTPAAQKQKLIEIGEALNAKLDVNDHANISDMTNAFADYTDYEVPDAYIEPEHRTAPRRMMQSLGKLASGNLASIRTVASSVLDIYRMETFTGVYEPDNYTESWKRTGSSDGVELRFKGPKGTYSVKAVGSPDEWSESRDEVEVHIPETVTATFSLNGSAIASVTVGSHLDTDAHKGAFASKYEANGYTLTELMDVTDDRMVTETTLTVNGQQLITTLTTLYGDQLADADQWEEDADAVYDNEDDPSPISRHFRYATTSTDIMGLMQVRGRVSSLARIIDKLCEDSEYDDEPKEWWNADRSVLFSTWENIEVLEAQAQHLNDYSDITVYYDGTPVRQAYLAFDVNEDDDNYEYWTGSYYERHLWYELVPVLAFPDGTTYKFDDYFTVGFGSLISDYEDLIDNFRNLFN